MVFASAFASFVYPINIAVYFAIFLYVAIKERLTRCGSGGKDDIARKDYQDRHTQYPYTLLKMYDLVLLWNNFSAWDINHAQLQKFFDANVSKCHLDVGVGSGYYPSHSKKLQKICKQDSMTLELWDLNAPPLKYASARIKDACDSSLTISTRQVNLLEDHVKQSGPTRFTTASMNYVFHCVVYPQMDGNVSKEEQAIEKFYRGFSQAKTVMTEGGTISGTTILTADDPAIPSTYSRIRLALARSRLNFLQNKAVHFYNQYDTMSAIEQAALKAGLKKKTTFIKGLVAHFVFEV